MSATLYATSSSSSLTYEENYRYKSPPPMPRSPPRCRPPMPPPRNRPTSLPGIHPLHRADLSQPQPRGYVVYDFPACHYRAANANTGRGYDTSLIKFHRRTLSIRGMEEILEDSVPPCRQRFPVFLEEPANCAGRPPWRQTFPAFLEEPCSTGGRGHRLRQAVRRIR